MLGEWRSSTRQAHGGSLVFASVALAEDVDAFGLDRAEGNWSRRGLDCAVIAIAIQAIYWSIEAICA
jgi:hypothetical protein